MGRASEYIAYLKENPKTLTDFRTKLSYITITEDIKEKRKELKLYKDKNTYQQ